MTTDAAATPNGWRLEVALATAAAGDPDRSAFVGGAAPLTLGQLDHAATVLAARLIAAGLPDQGFAAIATAEVTGFTVAALATLKAGAAYVPIDLRYPLGRAREALESGIADLVVGDPALPDGIVAGAMPHIVLDVPALLAAPRPDLPARPPGEIACVFFTSGSTGPPKGVLVGHAGIEGLILDPAFQVFRRGGRTAQITSFAFDAATLEIWGSLLAGSLLVEVPPRLLLSARGLAAFLRDAAITAAWLSTGHFNQLAAHDPAMFAGMDTLIIGGEAADAATIHRLFDAGRPPRRLLNGYGPTEATTLASWHEITPADAAAGVIPIGRPMAGRRLVVVDENLQPLPDGTPGELLIAGPAVARGYWHAPERTAQRFLPDTEHPGGLAYRSGDHCCVAPDGRMLYLGRIDDQVKIRGFRVEPSFVASALMALDGVIEAVVLPRATASGGRELVAFVRTSAVFDPADLRARLALRLADFMVPSVFVAVPTIPLGPNGKTDRAALLASAPAREIVEIAAAPPRTPSEARLMAVLGADSPHALLADLAPDSFAQVNLLVALETGLDRALPAETILELPDIAALAAWLDAAPATPARAFVIALPWALQPLPPALLAAIAGEAAVETVPLPPERLVAANAVETLAALACARIAERAPTGSIIIAGYSIAGIVAAEVAARLAAAGRELPLVVLIDADFGKPRLHRRLAARLWRPRQAQRMAPSPEVGSAMAQARRAVRRWRPQRLGMPVIALCSTDPDLAGGTTWHARCDGPFQHVQVPGSHLDLIRNEAVVATAATAIVEARRRITAR